MPRRLSVLSHDPGYSDDAHRYAVYLDGELLHDCHTADEGMGKAWVWDGPGTREVRGRVMIIGPISEQGVHLCTSRE